MNIDRFNWGTVRFGDLVKQATSTGKGRTGDRVVGLEHLDSDALAVRRSAPEKTDHAFTRRFRAGQVLYGKRRVYQRKAGRVGFDGVCSNDIIVMESASEALHADLLPIIIQTQSFVEHALATSVGSLSPRTNWKSIADFCFNLPTIEDQVRIADLVWASEEVAVRAQAAVDAAWAVEKRALEDAYKSSTWPIVRLDSVGEVQLGRMQHRKYQTGRFSRPYVRVANVQDDHLDLAEVFEMDFDDKHYPKFALMPGDVLTVEGNGSLEEIGRSAMWSGEIDECCFQKALLRFRPGPGVVPEFAYGWLRRKYYRGDLAKMATRTTTLANITAVRFAAMDFPLPGLEVQNEVVRRVAEAREARRALEEHARASRRLVRGLIDRIFSEDVPSDDLQRSQQRP
ncbi:restriction endonuclease subunit S [Actinomadura violacea]|uniref:Restriction endonuclease subunit S n=1 Tax=Actinomadura violacea TaxID=2819934 RepID=A0ABS3S7R2_9ACTN|nr:restriction endonuclease subunit S [Actinomadura violacea]MBO2465046.1 restriction endonuclease subunit S [Actinomadura violacea]